MKIEENSYAGLLNNPEFLSKAENVLMNTFGEVDFETKEELLDAFYEKFREIDVNEMDAYKLWSITASDEIDEEQKKELKDVYSVYRALPTFWEDDTANNTTAFVDYLVGGFTAPSTWLSVFTGGAAGIAARVALNGGVRAGLKTGIKLGSKTTPSEILASTAGGTLTDVAGAVIGDASLQGVEKQIDYSEGYNPYGTGLAIASALVPGAISGAVGLGAKKLFKGSDYTDIVAQGKQVYLESTEAGRAFLDNKIVEGSFVTIGNSKSQKNIGYIVNTNKDDTYTLNMGFDEKTGDPIQKVVKTSEVKVMDPFDAKIQKKIQREIIKDSEIFNKDVADRGFEDLQKQLKKYFKDIEIPVVKKGGTVDFDFKLSTNAMMRINNAFTDILQQASMMYNPNKRISQQVSDALENNANGFNSKDFTKILKANGVSKIEFVSFMQGSYLGTTRESAKILSDASRVKKEARKLFLQSFNQGMQKQFKHITGELKSEADLIGAAKNPLAYAQEVLGTTKLSEETEAYYSSMLAERARLDHWGGPTSTLVERGGQWNRMVRLGMIAQPATTIRNVMGGIIRTPVDATARTVDNIITSILPAFGGGPTHRPVNLLDGFDHLGAMFNPQEHRLMTEFIASVKPEVRKLLDGPEAVYEASQIANLASKMEGNKRGLVSRALGVVSDPLESALMKANILNSIQDRYMKSTSFMVGLKHSMAREGLDVYKFIKEGRIGDIDSRFINDGMEWALEYNYQSRNIAENAVGREFSDLVYKMSNLPVVGSAIIPFPKFLINMYKYLYEHSPLTVLPFSQNKFANMWRNDATGFQKDAAIKRLSKGISGTALLTLAYAVRNSEYAGTEWNLLKDDTPGQLDIATWFPFAPHAYMGEFIKQLVDDERTTIKDKTKEDFLKALLGTTGRSGIYRQLEAHSFDFLFDEDPMSTEKFYQALGRASGTIVAALTTPLKLIKDVQEEFLLNPLENDLETNIRILRVAKNSEGFGPNFLAQIFNNLPEGKAYLTFRDHGLRKGKDGKINIEYKALDKYRLKDPDSPRVPATRYVLYKEQPIAAVAPLYKQVTGIVKQQRMGLVEEEISRLGIVDWKLFRPTGLPEYDQALQLVGSSLVSNNLANYISNNKVYNQLNEENKAIELKNVISKMKKDLTSKFKELHPLGIIRTVASKPDKQVLRAIKQEQATGRIRPEVKTVLDITAEEANLINEVVKGLKKIPDLYGD